MTAQNLTPYHGLVGRLALLGGVQRLPLTYYNSARVVSLQHQVVRPALGRPNLDRDPKAAPALQGSTSRDLQRACKEACSWRARVKL